MATLKNNLNPPGGPSLIDAMLKISKVTTEQYVTALANIEATLSPRLREILIAHANTNNQTALMKELAEQVGCTSRFQVDWEYQQFGRKLAVQLRIKGLGNNHQVLAFCGSAGRPRENGQLHWKLQTAFYHAMIKLGMTAGQHDKTSDEETFAAGFPDEDDIKNEMPMTRKALIEARIGQGTYRKKMLYWWNDACAVTGCTIQEAIIASHAIPWKLSTNQERLDHFNGLPLVATLDALFDKGLISFTDAGELLIAPEIGASDRKAMGITSSLKLRKIDVRHIKYLEAHRTRFEYS